MRIKFPHSAFSILLLLSFCVALLTPSYVAAQVDENEKAQKELERRKELERKTLGLLDEIVAGSWGLKLPENRSFVLASAADLLWQRDEKRARNLFWEALNNLGLPTNPALDDSTTRDTTTKDAASNGSASKLAPNDKAQTLNQYYAMFGLRRDFLHRVAQRDPQLALDMLRATRLSPPDQVNANHSFPDDRDLEQEIANQAAAHDPKRALQLARESLAKGLTFQSYGVLSQLNQHNPEAGLEFAGDLIDKIQTTNVATDTTAWWMTIMLLRLARTSPDTPVDNTAVLGSGRLKLSDDQRRGLVEILTDAVLSVSANSDLLSGITQVMPDIEQFAPDRAYKVKAKLASRVLTQQQREWGKYNSLVRDGTPEELIRAAAGANESQRDALNQAAVMKAVMHGKGDALREFIKGEVGDRSQRNTLNDLLDSQEMSWHLNHGDVEEAQELLPSIRLKEKRAEAMARMAMLLEKKGEHDAAVRLLDEAQTPVKVDLASEKQSDALMAVLLAYSLIDPARAFALIEPIIDRANEDISKLLLLDRVVRSGAVKNGEIMMQQAGLISLDFAILKYGKGVVALANADFNRTKATADRFQRNELRIMARLLIAQTLLRNLEQTANKNEQRVQ